MFTDFIQRTQKNQKDPEDTANELLCLCKKNIIKPDQSPVTPIVLIAKSMGFSVRLVDHLPRNDSGCILIGAEFDDTFGSTKCIFISKKIKYEEGRFVLAHEIGHYLFDFNEQENANFSHTYTFNNNMDQNNEIERCVNKFASCLMMPEEIFVEEFENLRKKSTPLAQLYSELAKLFEITTKAVERRCEELALVKIPIW